MGCAPMAHVLFGSTMRFAPSDPHWPNRDRFVLSNGHACALQYAMLHLCGYDSVSLNDLKRFRQLDSVTPGHPERHLTDGVEVSTGPLGQGISNAVGLAVAKTHMAARYNRPGFPLFDHHVYVICGDGCLQEGVSAEACSLAGHLKLGSLVVLYDDNNIQIDGSTDLAFTEDVQKRFQSYGWQTLSVRDGDRDLDGLADAVRAAKADTSRPTLISVKTTIGFGSAKQGTHAVHGAPLGDEDVRNVKKRFGLDPERAYHVDPDVAAYYAAAGRRGDKVRDTWNTMFASYRAKHADLGEELARRFRAELPKQWDTCLPTFAPGDKNATRGYSGKVLAALSPRLPEMMCGSADLSPSNKTNNAGWGGDFQATTPAGRYIRFGVREHAMAAISNGLHAYGGVVPACATFLSFAQYGLGSIRLSALSHHHVIYVMTHDSIALGEDGPTHQPVEHLAMLRAMPNMLVIRPCDGNETSGAYKVALTRSKTPTTLALSRQKVVTLSGSSADAVARGAYVVDDCAATTPDLILVGTGAEVQLCVEAKQALARDTKHNVRVVSMPCWRLYEEQSATYKRSVFPSHVPVLSVEAGSTCGWARYAHASVGMHTFGKSAKGSDVMNDFGFTAANVATKANAMIAFYATDTGRVVPDLLERPF